ncbi:hypothetical protein [Aureimonas sp. Leaf324]|uniref:hypothetical protein n=1 Tax=Aureimonas sp. Leaf324 TaxID=1736336 RepID=UPI0012E113CA|nr:hypothetical protein [Aureimonas sp. Leaf324]
MVDAVERPVQRFPAAREAAAAAWLRHEVGRIADQANAIQAFSSGANGGDILFLEACQHVSVEATIVLPFPPEIFVGTSVASAGGDWERRFQALWDATPPIRREIMNLPITTAAAYTACNLRLLNRARKVGDIHLLVLWDGQRGREGGTAELVQEAEKLRASITSADPLSLPRND